jgi:HlyD family secretion protein
VVKYNCVIHVDNRDLALKPGMTATVSIEVERREDVLKVASEALRFVPELPADELAGLRRKLETGESVLWVPVASRLEPRRVQTGLAGDMETEISGTDVTEGMTVVTALREEEAETRRFRPFSLF